MYPFGDMVRTLTQDSTAAEANDFLNFRKGKYRQHRESLFAILPEKKVKKVTNFSSIFEFSADLLHKLHKY